MRPSVLTSLLPLRHGARVGGHMTRRLWVGLVASVVFGCSNGPRRDSGPDSGAGDGAAQSAEAQNALRRVAADGTEVLAVDTAGGPLVDEAPLGVVVRLRAPSTFEHRAALRAAGKRATDVESGVRTHRVASAGLRLM